MIKKYYDTWEFSKAIDEVNTNPIKAKEKFENYLNEYPDDYCMQLYYASCLMSLGKFEKAEKIIKDTEKRSREDIKFNSNKNKVISLRETLAYNKIRLLCLTERYEELDKVCLKYRKEIQKLNLVSILFFSQIKNKVLNKSREDVSTYGFKQIVEYSENDFKEHIQKHLADYNKDLDVPNKSIFVPNFPVEDILLEIKKHIPSKTTIYSGFYENKYVFKYDECGRDNNKMVNYFIAIAFNNTSDLITIYPSSECENLPFIDLNYMKKDTIEPKVKIPSQIEKFNKRFKRN